jgi:hypothetical protein
MYRTTAPTSTARRVFLALALALTATAGVAACGEPVTDVPAPTAAEAHEPAPEGVRSIADSALRALDAGDYGQFSAHWSKEMKQAIDANAFAEFHRSVQKDLGGYTRTLRVTKEPAKTPGTVNYVAHAVFEKGRAELWLNFREGRLDEVSGSRLTPRD